MPSVARLLSVPLRHPPTLPLPQRGARDSMQSMCSSPPVSVGTAQHRVWGQRKRGQGQAGGRAGLRGGGGADIVAAWHTHRGQTPRVLSCAGGVGTMVHGSWRAAPPALPRALISPRFPRPRRAASRRLPPSAQPRSQPASAAPHRTAPPCHSRSGAGVSGWVS